MSKEVDIDIVKLPCSDCGRLIWTTDRGMDVLCAKCYVETNMGDHDYGGNKLAAELDEEHLIKEYEQKKGDLKKKIFCDYLGWHSASPDFSKSYFGQIKGQCKRCGKEVILDSQGNWF